MNYGRIALAGNAGTIAFFATGFLIGGTLIAKFYAPYTAVYRPVSAVMNYFPIGIAATFLAILVLAAIYAKGYEGGSGLAEGARFGLLVGIFMALAVVGDEYVTLNIGRELALAMAAGKIIGWLIVGIAIGLVYRPAPAKT